MSCPDLDTLFDPLGIDESKRHVEGCADCQRLVVMVASIGGEIHRGPHCAEAELLIAAMVTGPLDPDCDRWLREHLGGCRRCSNTTRAVLLDPPAAELASAPLSVFSDKTIRIAIPIAAIAATVVLLVVLVSRMGGDDADRPGAAARPVESPAIPIDAAVRPAPPVDAEPETVGPLTQREAREAIKTAVRGGSLAAAYAGCEHVRGTRWVKKCVVLACRSRSELQARRYLARLPQRERTRFVKLCRAQGIDIE